MYKNIKIKSFATIGLLSIVLLGTPSCSYADSPSFESNVVENKPQPNWGKIIKSVFKSFKKAPKKAPRSAPKINPQIATNPRLPVVAPIVTHDASTAVHNLGITASEHSFIIGGKTVNNEEDLLQEISKQIQKKAASFPRNATRIEVMVDGLGGGNEKVQIGTLKSVIKTTAPRMLDFDIDHLTTVITYYQGKTCTKIIIPKKISKVSMLRLQESDQIFYVETSYCKKIIGVIKKLYKEGGLFTQRRFNNALMEARIPSSAILREYNSFIFAKETGSDYVQHI